MHSALENDGGGTAHAHTGGGFVRTLLLRTRAVLPAETIQQTLGASVGFLTNAIKDTVSVLYWYEELSRSNSGNFWMVQRTFFVRFLSRGGGRSADPENPKVSGGRYRALVNGSFPVGHPLGTTILG